VHNKVLRAVRTKRPEPPTRTPAVATTLRRGLITTVCSYVKRPCPSVHTSYSRYSSNIVFFTPHMPALKPKSRSPKTPARRSVTLAPPRLLTSILEGKVLPASAALESHAPFRAPVGFAPQEEQLLPAPAIDDEDLRAIDEAPIRRYPCNVVLHRPTPLPRFPSGSLVTSATYSRLGWLSIAPSLQEGLWAREPRRVVSISPRR
jgi:hypothetical protein